MKKELNFELLKSLYKVFSPSKNEGKMRRFIKRHVNGNIPGVTISQDKAGNLYLTKGVSESYPCICAHMDQVQHLHPKDFECVEGDDVIFGYSKKTRSQCGLGADDKNGLFIALECLASYDVMKCAFFVAEEIGCVGSGSADMEFFKDCRYCIQVDRRGNGDMVTDIHGRMCSDEFIRDAAPEKYGYAPSSGAMTDVLELTENGVGISCVNLSCGYYAPHTDNEYTSKSDVQKCYDFVCHIIEDCTRTYPFDSFNYDFDDAWPMDRGMSKGRNMSKKEEEYARGLVMDNIADTLHTYPESTFHDVHEELVFLGFSKYFTDEEMFEMYEKAKEEINGIGELA